MSWKLAGHGGVLAPDKNVSGASHIYDPRGCKHSVIVNPDDKRCWHYVTGSKNPYPTDSGRIIRATNVHGSPSIAIKSSGLMTIECPRDAGGALELYVRFDAFEDPSDEPPGPVKELPIELQFKTTGILVTPYFAKCGLINFMEYTTEDFYEFINILVTPPYKANSIKCFLYGVWYPGGVTSRLIRFPHPKNSQGQFILNEIDGVYWDQLISRIRYAVDHGIAVRLIQDDNCQIERAWDHHWINPDNNTGWKGKPTYYDKYGWTHWVNYIDHNAPGATPEELEMYTTNKDYILWLYDKFLTPLEAEFGSMITWETNEIEAYGFWHEMKWKLLDSYGVPFYRRITSTPALDYMAQKPQINQHFIMGIHGVAAHSGNTLMENYVLTKAEFEEYGWNGKWKPSGDGGGNEWYGTHDAIAPMIRAACNDGLYFLEGNSWADNPVNIDQEVGKIFMEEFRKIL